ncbi:dihydrofolate reductase [Actimicrobium sp. GrIS 1.19]|uniref:dihydrofolate reductase n=1 Tax=Actimicrobium sp. GrIS 1.19 TaxID=3071708 RepID=UPI002E0944C9|nr:dihydrofolate reductase [Actimicrobium sp. GrIS 1.19]
MTILTLIVATDAAGGIGINNTLPWKLPEDLAHFKRTTTGHPILMGRKTFESIGRALPNRRNIVVSRNPDWRHDGVETALSLQAGLNLCDGDAVFVIGGAELYRLALPLAQRLIVTEIAARFDCDAFFPAIEAEQWAETAREQHHATTQQLDFSFVTYQRKQG